MNPSPIDSILEKLLHSPHPIVRFKTQVQLLGKNPEEQEILSLQKDVKSSVLIQQLLSERNAAGKIPLGVYTKWRGAHWVLAMLADLGYPAGDSSLIPLREQEYEWLFSKTFIKQILCIEGRYRRCGSQEGNAIYSLFTLGLADNRIDELVQRLLQCQWQDGGWNCDKKPAAINSSYHESILPLRALALYARETGNSEAKSAVDAAAELFLKRRLYKRQRDGKVICNDFIKLNYPYFWRYNILIGLKVMAEAGFIHDPRCNDALDLLESKQLPDGGFPAEMKYYNRTATSTSGINVDWGGVNKKQMNEFVTLDALYVLKQAGRIRL